MGNQTEPSFVKIVGIFVLAIASGLATIAILLAKPVNLNVTDSISATSILGSIGLTSILSYLYFRIASLQDSILSVQEGQKDIMKQQADTMETQAEIQKARATVKPDFEGWDVDDEDRLRICVSNHGTTAIRGVAAILSFDWEHDSYSPREISVPLKKEREGRLHREASFIGPNEERVILETNTLIQWDEDGDKKEGPFSELTRTLAQDGIDEISFNLYCETVDIQGNPRSIPVAEGKGRIYRNMTFREFREELEDD